TCRAAGNYCWSIRTCSASRSRRSGRPNAVRRHDGRPRCRTMRGPSCLRLSIASAKPQAAPDKSRLTMRILLLAAALLAVVLVVAWIALYPVDRGEYVYVTQFGQLVGIHDGLSDGGLHAKLPWPVQSVQRLDRRLQHFDLPETELLTHDPEGKTIDKTLTVV